jgi:hypothetical protein
MQVAVVTSCSNEGFQRYGRRFLDTFHRFWPVQTPIHIVSEDTLNLPLSITGSKRSVSFWDLASSPAAASFYERHKSNAKAHGLGQIGIVIKPHERRPGYSYRHDAYRFSKKVFAIELVMQKITAGRLVWLDADIVTLCPVPDNLMFELPPQDHSIAYLDRSPHHSECGFVGYNLEHAATRPFVSEFTRLYASDEVFALREWHDSWVFDFLRLEMEVPSYAIPHTKKSLSHPFVHSVLGQYMDHLKGSRKERGVSHDHPKFTRKGRPVVVRPRRMGRTARHP